MEKEKFYKMLNNKEYEELEKELKNEYSENKDLETKYQLGICYGEQFNKIENAKKVFKELMSTEFNPPYIYSFNAKHTSGNIEKQKIINEGIRNYPDSKMLNNQLLFYLESNEKEQHYKELDKKGILNIPSIMEMISYYFEREEFSKANNIFKDKKTDIENAEFNLEDIGLIRILSAYLSGEKIDLNEISSLIITDNNTIKGIILRLVEIDIVSKENISKAKELLRQVNYRSKYPEDFIELINFSDYTSSCFTISKILFDIVDKLILKFEDAEEQRKLRLIKSLHYLYWEEDDVKKSELRLIEKDLKEELKCTEKSELYKFLLDIYEKLKDNKKYFMTFIKAIENCGNKEKYTIGFCNFKELELDYVVDYICNNIKVYSFNSNTYQKLIEAIIEELFKRKKYDVIVRITESIDFKKLDCLKFGFELAYSYKELKKDKESKKIYEEYMDKYPNSDATINNLGVIYEKEGNLKKALELYEKAEKICHDKIYTNNIKRCNSLIEEMKREEDKFSEALALFEKENIWVINELKLFYLDCDENNNVICSYKRLPSLLKCSDAKAQELLNMFLDKNYIFKNKNHNYNTNSNVYRINTAIYERIKQLEKENILVSNFTDNLNNFTIENLKNLDYMETQQKLSEIKNQRIKDIFIRDYNELVYNYLSNQSKTVVLMSGTIIELLLIYILQLNSISKYNVGSKGKNKKIEEMDISEMLEVCTSEKLIHNVPKKFIDGMKNFRNFVHPGKEIREKLLEIDKQTVDLLMSIVRWLILTLDLK